MMPKSTIEYLFIEPAGVCNLQCIMCDAQHISSLPKKGLDSKIMNTELFEQIFSALFQRNKISYVEFQGLGEPLLAIENLAKMIKYVKKQNAFAEITTNGMLWNARNADLLVREGLGGVIVSVDSSNAEQFRKIRKHVNPQTVKSNIQKTVDTYKSVLQISINSVIHDYNRPHIVGMVKYAIDVGVDSIQFLHLINRVNERGFMRGVFGSESKESLVEIFEEVKSIGAKNELLVITPELNPQRRTCSLLEKSITVAYDGRTNPCCRLDRPDKAYHGKMPYDTDAILRQHTFFLENYANLDFCALCTSFLWNYDVLMTKFKYTLDKKKKGDTHGL